MLITPAFRGCMHLRKDTGLPHLWVGHSETQPSSPIPSRETTEKGKPQKQLFSTLHHLKPPNTLEPLSPMPPTTSGTLGLRFLPRGDAKPQQQTRERTLQSSLWLSK